MSASFHIIRFEGFLDISRYPEFRTAFEEAARSVPVLLDLASADSADSTFLAEMLMARRRHQAPFSVLIAPGGNMAKLFEIAGLGEKMRVFTDLTAAVESLRLAAPGQPDEGVPQS
jgi:anti-anti-sigma regulatory factor